MKNPYLDEMRFRVNKDTIEIENPFVAELKEVPSNQCISFSCTWKFCFRTEKNFCFSI